MKITQQRDDILKALVAAGEAMNEKADRFSPFVVGPISDVV